MRITSAIPLEITVTHYSPGDPGNVSGPPEDCYPPEPPEIEFTVHTASGTELTEDDFPNNWESLVNEVLTAYETELAEARTEAAISAYEARQEAWNY